jgi:hypothetical protein
MALYERLTCCAVLPYLFENLIAKYMPVKEPGTPAAGNRLTKISLREGVRFYECTDFKGEIGAQQESLNVYGMLKADSDRHRMETPSQHKPGVKKSMLLGSRAADAQKTTA